MAEQPEPVSAMSFAQPAWRSPSAAGRVCQQSEGYAAAVASSCTSKAIAAAMNPDFSSASHCHSSANRPRGCMHTTQSLYSPSQQHHISRHMNFQPRYSNSGTSDQHQPSSTRTGHAPFSPRYLQQRTTCAQKIHLCAPTAC